MESSAIQREDKYFLKFADLHFLFHSRMECTQALNLSTDEDDDFDTEIFRKKVFGKLLVWEVSSEEAKTYEIFGGKNKIGRDPAQSDITIDRKVSGNAPYKGF